MARSMCEEVGGKTTTGDDLVWKNSICYRQVVFSNFILTKGITELWRLGVAYITPSINWDKTTYFLIPGHFTNIINSFSCTPSELPKPRKFLTKLECQVILFFHEWSEMSTFPTDYNLLFICEVKMNTTGILYW